MGYHRVSVAARGLGVPRGDCHLFLLPQDETSLSLGQDRVLHVLSDPFSKERNGECTPKDGLNTFFHERGAF